MSKIILYSAPGCVYCKLAKRYFADHGINFVEYDVARDREKLAEMQSVSHQLGVPVIVIGSEVFVGFDRKAIASRLGIR